MSAPSAFVRADADQLLAWARDRMSATRLSALTGCVCLLVDAGPDRLDDDEMAVVRCWLSALACPTIGVGTSLGALASSCDAHAVTRAEAETLARNIERAPLAASLLMQVLRAVETMSIEEGLLVESLAYSSLQAGPEFLAWCASFTASAVPSARDPGPAVEIRRDQDHLTLELNRPSRRNAMSIEMRDGLIESLQLVLADDSIRQVEIRGRGRCFSTGGDLDEFGSAPDPATAHVVRRIALPGRLLEACRDRVSVHLHGACIGSGIEFPAFAARIVASPDTWFQLPELRYGLIPGAGGCVSITRRIGRQRTAWLALSGKRIDVETALKWGLVDAITARPAPPQPG
jgi:enoyl-CoA hydratase